MPGDRHHVDCCNGNPAAILFWNEGHNAAIHGHPNPYPDEPYITMGYKAGIAEVETRPPARTSSPSVAEVQLAIYDGRHPAPSIMPPGAQAKVRSLEEIAARAEDGY